MPIYDYACRSCGRRVEVIHGINDPGPGACDVCGGVMAKLLSPPAIVFKGTGWAKKDARASTATKTDTGDGAANDAGRDAGSTGDKKPAADAAGPATAKASDAKSPGSEKTGGAPSGPTPSRGSTGAGGSG